MNKVDIKLTTKRKLFPIDTCLITEDGSYYRYVLDKEGYKWIREELWTELKRGGK